MSFVDAWIKFKHWIHSHTTTTHNGITTTRPVIIMAHNGKIYDFKIIHYNLKRILSLRIRLLAGSSPASQVRL